MIKFCKYCFEHPESDAVGDNGYMPFLYDSTYKCPGCGNKLEDVNISSGDYMDIVDISGDIGFIQAMIKLHDENPIEYQLKMQQFKAQQAQQQSSKKLQNSNNTQSNQRTCRFCGSTSFTPIKRKWSPLTGFLTNKTDLVCNNCGKKVQWIDR